MDVLLSEHMVFVTEQFLEEGIFSFLVCLSVSVVMGRDEINLCLFPTIVAANQSCFIQGMGGVIVSWIPLSSD